MEQVLSNSLIRNSKVQILRGLAILAVVGIHTCPGGKWQIVIRPFINYAVALFLFLSGYLTSIPVSNVKEFYKKRILRVLIPYIIWTMVYTILSNQPERILKNMLTTEANSALYYIFVYIQFVLITPFLDRLVKSKWSWAGWCVAPVSAIIFKYIPLFSNFELSRNMAIFWNICGLGWFTYYYLGIMLGNHLITKDFRWKRLGTIYIVAVILQMLEGYTWFLAGNTNPGTQIKISAFLTESIFLLFAYCYLKSSYNNSKGKLLQLLGDCSFGIYLTHIMIMKILEKIPGYEIIPFGINTIIVLAVSLCFVLLGRRLCGTKFSEWIGLK